MELQVTENFVCGSGISSHRIFYVSNSSGSLCNGSKDMAAQGRRPLGQSHLGGVIIYWRWHILEFCFCFLRNYQAVTNKFREFMYPAL